ncbi:hypothetical protein [Bailinhaonella thermotolerans]|uniref:hypothetical protein n=1 Tax=Bailinhaonella thermotolerans TaxID=1070861 RepID=UPI0011C3FE27|nr:hypothetical protein [Bailinhaonella thermotolerans]
MTGDGSGAAPYVVAGPAVAMDCGQVRACMARLAGPGLEWLPGTEELAVKIAEPTDLEMRADGLWAPSTAPDCAAVVDCVPSALGPGMSWDAVTERATWRLSADAGQGLTVGADGGVMAGGGVVPDPTAWSSLVAGDMLNGWRLSSPTPQWRRMGDGLIQWQGEIGSPTSATPPVGQAMVNLPVGARPTSGTPLDFTLPVLADNVVLAVRVTATQMIVQYRTTLTENSFYQLDTVSYY